MRACFEIDEKSTVSREELDKERWRGTMQGRESLIISAYKPSMSEQVEVLAGSAVVIWLVLIREKLKVGLLGRDGGSLEAATISSAESGGEESQTAV